MYHLNFLFLNICHSLKPKAYKMWGNTFKFYFEGVLFKKHEAVCGLYGGACCRKKIYICVYIDIDIWNIHDTHLWRKEFRFGNKNRRYNFLFAKYL